jgi:Ca2+/H+ antiporter, TMEM165/GDT1 family
VAIAVTLFPGSPGLVSSPPDTTTPSDPLLHPVGLTIIESELTAHDLSSSGEVTPALTSADKPSLGCEFKVFASTFVTIFLAELGDKTQLTTLLMSAESQSPWIVFAGAGVALVCTSLLGILLGRWLATKVTPKTLEISAGCLLLLIATTLFWDILHA